MCQFYQSNDTSENPLSIRIKMPRRSSLFAWMDNSPMPDYISFRHRTNHYRRDPEFQYLEDELNGHHRRRRTSEQRHHHNDGYGGRRSSNTALSGLHSSRRQQHHRGLAQHAQHASSYYGTHAFDDVSSSHRSRRSGTSPSDHQQSHRRRRSNEP